MMGDAAALLVPILVPGIVALLLFVGGGIALMRSGHARVRRKMAEGGATVPMACGSCGARFGMPMGEVVSARFTRAPRRQLTRQAVAPATIRGIPAAAGMERAVRSSHYYECPACRRKAWLRVEDPDAFYEALRPAAGEGARMLLLVPWGFACLALMAGLSAVLRLVF